ncbi:MAG: carbohydrate kinase [Lachnospiraceae bacterium]|jgi:fructokinase|nr:carbohydrate kinase [Lachnospiraceae bacterium]MDD3617369.1 carbohydrate kinase [Lachnospiraceae bacterium]
MSTKYDVVALGELLIDFTESGESEQKNPLFEANPGGAPCNVLAMLKKLGKECAFIGKVGNDMFGKQLTDTIEAAGIHTEGLVVDPYYNTTLAFVKTFANGDRDFSFYRHPGADMMLGEEEVDYDMIENAKLFHFGTLSMTDEKVRKATLAAIACAQKNNLIISFDPNYREPLWNSVEEAKEQIAYGLSVCHVLKIADNEIELMTGETDFDKGAAILHEKYPNIKILNVTAGGDGSFSYYNGRKVFQPACSNGGVIETTGAGDTFCASVLNFVLEHGMDNLSDEDLAQMLKFANTAAYIVTTKKGAIRSMPEKSMVEELLNK